MDRLTATIMLANDPSLVLVFVPLPDADDPLELPYVFCNKCAVHGPASEFSREMWVNTCWYSVGRGRLNVHAVSPAEAARVTDQHTCDTCGRILG